MQDIEFTVEDTKLYFLQTRAGKRTPRAALKIAIDLVREGLIDEVEAIRRVGDIDPASTVMARFAGAAKAHAAVVARQLGKACLVGCSALTIDAEHRSASIAGQTLAEGEWLSLDAESGEIYLGKRDILHEQPQAELAEIEAWKSKIARKAT